VVGLCKLRTLPEIEVVASRAYRHRAEPHKSVMDSDDPGKGADDIARVMSGSDNYVQTDH
jgi:hypothetical protein